MMFAEFLVVFFSSIIFVTLTSTILLVDRGYGWEALKSAYILISFFSVIGFMAYVASNKQKLI